MFFPTLCMVLRCRCTSCTVSDFPCTWCVQNHICTHNRESCMNDVLITGQHVSWGSHSCDVNSLWPDDILWCPWSHSSLFQIMAWCLIAPSHYLKQWWLLDCMTNILQWNLNEFIKNLCNKIELKFCSKYIYIFPNLSELTIYNLILVATPDYHLASFILPSLCVQFCFSILIWLFFCFEAKHSTIRVLLWGNICILYQFLLITASISGYLYPTST